VSLISALESSSYTLDNAFRITGISNASTPSASWTYGYDTLDRLTSANAAANISWTYDANGNRQTQLGAAAPVYPASNVTLNYNNRGRMSGATGSASSSYIYNALGQRMAKSSGGATTLFAYDESGHLLGEYSNSGALIEETVWLGDIPVASIRPGSPAALYYVHADHLNTPKMITRPVDSAVMWRWDQDPFGTAAPNQNPAAQGIFVYNLRYPGQYYDSETGLSYNYFRDYDAQVGRYVESDPIGLNGGSFSTYNYVNGNTLWNIDPYGLDVMQCAQPALGWMPIDHWWLKTDTTEAGMGGTKGNVPGNQSGDMPGDPVEVVNHAGRSKQEGSSCKVVPNVDEKKVNEQLELGRKLGRWGPTNQCQSFVKDVLKNARYSPGASGTWRHGATGSW
jgi:RHS repeat-associated protein